MLSGQTDRRTLMLRRRTSGRFRFSSRNPGEIAAMPVGMRFAPLFAQLVMRDSTDDPEKPLRRNRNERLGSHHKFFLPEKGCVMNWDQVQGNWKQFKGQVKQQWGKLTDDDLDRIEGKRDELAGRIQARYGIAKDQVDKEIDSFCQSCKC
jgi:uncharacterized protein YjbJ (UPF0337 family)